MQHKSEEVLSRVTEGVERERAGRKAAEDALEVTPRPLNPLPPIFSIFARVGGLQGYLAHTKQQPPIGTPSGPRHSPTVGEEERGLRERGRGGRPPKMPSRYLSTPEIMNPKPFGFRTWI